MSSEAPVITVDGPSGAGKGTISRLVAKATGFHLLDSGAIYRLAALAALNANADLTDEAAVAAMASRLDVSFSADETAINIRLAGEDVTWAIRDEQVGMAASKIAALPAVRSALLARQRAFAKSPGLVADGRDMGTVVFPQAPLKIFLTASAETRAKRRQRQLQEVGVTADYHGILADIQARDERDCNRKSAPLIPAMDALVLDSTQLTIEEVLARVLEQYRQIEHSHSNR